jgi:DNA-binding transcriptional LysR family regulator
MGAFMRIDLLGLQAFVAISERGSFHLAAAHLNLSQTALSHRIRKLEDDLGAKLLDRTTRGVSLTRVGLELLPQVKDAIQQLGDSLSVLRSAELNRQDSLAIGCLPTLAAGYLPAAIEAFRERNPAVQLRIFDTSASGISELLQAGTISFGINMVAAHRWDFDIELLTMDPFCLVCREDHPLASKKAVEWTDLSGYPLTRVSQQTGNRILLDDALGSRREQLSWLYEVQHLYTAIELVRHGLALAVIPQLAMGKGKIQGLTTVLLKNPAVSRQIGIMTRRGVPISPLADELRKHVVAVFSQQRAVPKAR